MPLPRTTIQAVRQFASEHALFRPGPLLVAVSGGTDSTALLLILRELADEHGLVLHVAHFDHRARPRASAADAQYVADLAAGCQVGHVLRVGGGGPRADTVIEMSDVEDQAVLVGQLAEDQEQGGRVRPTRDRDEQRAGPEEGVLAREGTDRLDRAAREWHWWLGWDLNPRSGGYESPALGH